MMSTDSTPMSSIPSATTTILLCPSSKILSKGKNVLDNEDIVKIMERKLSTKDFRIKKWTLDPIPGTNGYMGQYFNLRVTCSVRNEESENFVFFAKTRPQATSPQWDFVIRSDVMNKEIKAYEDLLPLMGAGNGMDWKSDSFLGKRDTILVLEDATIQGYAMPDKYVPFGVEECRVMLHSLAKFHSKSFSLDNKLRHELGKTIKDLYGDLLEEALFPRVDQCGGNIMLPGIQGACSMVDLVEELDESSKEKIKKRINNWANHTPKLLDSSEKYKNVTCHRDVWANNFMLKRDGQERLQGCYLVDFQFLSYLPPAVDFMFSIYLNTRRKTREEHFENFVKMYYEFLTEELNNLGLDVEDFVGWKEFRESCDVYRPLAIIYAAINQQIMLIDQESADKYFTKSPELLDEMLRGPGRAPFVCSLFKKHEKYRERITDNILDIQQWLPDDVL